MGESFVDFIVGLLIGVFFVGLVVVGMVVDYQYETTLKEVKPYANYKCEMSYKDMEKNQKKFCDYYTNKEK